MTMEIYIKKSEKTTINNIERIEAPSSADRAEVNQEKDSDIHFGIVTALSEEYAAMAALLEDSHEEQKNYINPNDRVLVGHIAAQDSGTLHKVALILLPQDGNNSATAAVTALCRNYPTIGLVIMCGIAAGVPVKPGSTTPVLFKGDVVVATKGVFAYDYGKEVKDSSGSHGSSVLEPKDGSSIDCGSYFKSAVRQISRSPAVSFSRLNAYVEKIGGSYSDSKYSFMRPNIQQDEYEVPEESCDKGFKTITRDMPPESTVHDNVKLGSGDRVIKFPGKRDFLYATQGVWAFDMETFGTAYATKVAGIQYLSVRGISDYGDTTKKDDWHDYAAAMAASYVYALIHSTPPLSAKQLAP